MTMTTLPEVTDPTRPPSARDSRRPEGGGTRRIDLGLIGIVIGFATFVLILVTNTLPAQRELRSRERIADEYEDAVVKLRDELDRERRYHDAVKNDPDVILSLWLRRNPGADEADPAHARNGVPSWWKDVIEAERRAHPAPGDVPIPGPIEPEAPTLTRGPTLPSAPSRQPTPTPPRTAPARDSAADDFPSFLYR